MAKFNATTSTRTTNHEGHVAYSMQPKAKLITQVLCSFFDEQKFYSKSDKQAICETVQAVIKTDPQFVSSLAVFARREFNMRSVSHVLTCFLANMNEGKPYVKDTVRGVVLRGDDATEIISFYLSEFGKPIPNSLRRAMRDVLSTFDAYTLAKYKGEGHAVKMRDLLRICRPHPETEEQSSMWKQLLDGTLPPAYTWETELSAKGNNAETWQSLIASGRLPFMAMLRNIRNIIEAQPSNIEEVYKKLYDPAIVKQSRQLPFRFLSAYKNLPPAAGIVAVEVLESAAEAAIANVPRLPGKTVIAVDVSGSMSCSISVKSDIRCCEVGMMLGLIANKICDESVFLEFNSKLFDRAIPRRTGLLYACVNESRSTGGTDMSLPFKYMTEYAVKADRVIIISDNECNSYNRHTVQTFADEYRRKVNPDLWVHAIDLQGLGTQQFAGPKTNIIAGWSEKVFDFILLAEQGEGNLEKTIAEYKW